MIKTIMGEHGITKPRHHGIVHKRSQALIDFACRYATEAHGDQKRKYTGEPYIVHPIAVAQLVASVTDDCNMISAAFLHDVIEDTDKTFDDIRDAGFGYEVAEYVLGMTDVSVLSDGNRVTRKKMDREHLQAQCHQVQTIKLADLIDNSKSIIMHGGKFAPIYMAEKKLLLEVLTKGDASLRETALGIVKGWKQVWEQVSEHERQHMLHKGNKACDHLINLQLQESKENNNEI